MAEGRALQKSLPHELVDRFAAEVSAEGLGPSGDEVGVRPGQVGGRMVRVLIQYAEGKLDP